MPCCNLIIYFRKLEMPNSTKKVVIRGCKTQPLDISNFITHEPTCFPQTTNLSLQAHPRKLFQIKN